MGYSEINKQMRTSAVNCYDMTSHINNISKSLGTYGFEHPVRLFRTEANDYTQKVNEKCITSRKLCINDTWNFLSFISTAVTNKPSYPKCQNGKITVFVFEFKTDQDIKELYLGQTVGMKGEGEFLLAPGVAKVTNAYKQKIGLGYTIQKAKFVVCNLEFFKKEQVST